MNSILLSTKRCTLRNLQESDFTDAVELFINEQVRAYLGGVVNESVAYSKLHDWLKKDDLYLCIRGSRSNDFIGIISFTKHHDGDERELSYQLLPQYWGHGIATEVIKSFLDYLKSLYDVKEIVAETQSLNMRSCRLLENLGFSIKKIVWRFGAEQRIYSCIIQ